MSAVETANEADLPGLAGIDPLALSHAGRRNEIALAVADGRCQLVRDGGAIRGYALFHTHFFGQGSLELLFIAEGQRRRGFGCLPLRHLVALHYGRKLFSSTNSSNPPMQALLAEAGFARSGIIENLDEGDPERICCHLPEGGAGP